MHHAGDAEIGRQRLTRSTGIAVAVVAAALALLPELGTTPLVDWDESIYAAVGRAVHDGSALRLEWNGDAYDRKPPLLFWAIAASYELFGVSEMSTRLPSALAGVATVAVVAIAVSRRAGTLAALLSTAFLLGSTLFLERGGRRACTDALLILFTTFALWRATEDDEHRSPLQAGIAVGLAILSKGVAGVLAPVALLLSAPLDPARRKIAVQVGMIGAAVALPWYAAQVWARGGDFVASHLGYEVLERALRPIHGDGAPWSYPLQVLWENGGAWVAAVPLVVLLRAVLDRSMLRDAAPWLIAAALVLGAAMSMQTKLPWYPLPALPMLAVAAGMALARGRAPSFAPARSAAAVVLVVAAANSIVLTAPARRSVVDDELQFEPFRALGAQIAAALSDEPFIGATTENPTLIFYGGRPMRVFPPDELKRRLLDPASLPRAALIAEADAPEILELGGEEIARFGDRVLLRYVPASVDDAVYETGYGSSDDPDYEDGGVSLLSP